MVDLGRQLNFPTHIAVTSLRPDIIILSEVTEMTVPWEDRLEEAFERKNSKYQELVEECQRQGWKPHCHPVEVGCRGFTGRSLYRAYTGLSMSGPLKKTAIRAATEAVERASRWLWIKRGDPWANAAGTQVGA